MNHVRLTAKNITCALALLLGAGSAVAAPPGTISVPQVPTQLVGSDTLNLVVDTVLLALRDGNPANGEISGAVDGLLTYNGLGSGAGEQQLEGSPTGTQPTCTPNDTNGAPDTNPGCQEMSPMSRPMDGSICEDEEAVGEAEGLAICVDGIVVVTNNAAHQRFALPGTCAAAHTTPNNDSTGDGFPDFTETNTGRINESSLVPGTAPAYTLGAGFPAGQKWKDVLRILYTGCLAGDGACGSALPRIDTTAGAQRSCNGAVRQALVANWGLIFEGEDCANGACPNGLRHAYRRDDNSGTTAVFLELIGVVGRSLVGRTTVFNALSGALTAIPASFAFCDGGQLEGFWPDPNGLLATPLPKGDPIHRNCASEDDMCGADGTKSASSPLGTIGVVRAIRSPIAGGYAPAFCEIGKFSPRSFSGWNTSSVRICPDGEIPKAGACRLPFWEIGDTNADGDTLDAGERNYNCMNPRNHPDGVKLGANAVDGRSYNYVMRTEAGVVTPISGSTVLPEVAQWRQNSNTLNEGLGGNAGGLFPGTNRVCQEADATRQIGCLVANTTCTLGFSGREAASIDPFDDLQEPINLNSNAPSNAGLGGPYPLKRDLFVNAIGGFGSLGFDCLDRGGSVNYCADQVILALEFFNMSATVRNACTAASYIPLAAARCDGANHALAAGCGAPLDQSADPNACLPQ